MILFARASADSCSGMPSRTEVRPFSTALRCSQVTLRSSGTWSVAEHVRVPGDQLVGDAAGDVLEGEPVRGLGGDLGVEDHLEQQIAELLPKMIMVAGLDRLDRLAGLLDQVLHQREVGLLGVPRALPAQPGHHRDQPLDLGSTTPAGCSPATGSGQRPAGRASRTGR